MNEFANWLVKFETPAFLGNSAHRGQWRTPPFKSLLREWWRISRLQSLHYDTRNLRTEEGELFGTAADEPGRESRKSRVRLRLSAWNEASCSDVHAKLSRYQVESSGHAVSAGVYLGYGPVQQAESRSAIMPGDPPVTLTIGIEGSGSDLSNAICLIQWFGTMGSRARNGWGSVSLAPASDGPEDARKFVAPALTASALKPFVRSWRECLNSDWPQAIGADDQGRPLVWHTKAKSRWEEAMQELAEIRIAIDTLFDPACEPATPKSRHLLSYPVTKLEVPGWDNRQRIPSQLRFKVIRTGDGLVGRIVHLPCRVPDEAIGKIRASTPSIISQEVNVWTGVHRKLDEMSPRLVRLA